jgi:hypothetical protein
MLMLMLLTMFDRVVVFSMLMLISFSKSNSQERFAPIYLFPNVSQLAPPAMWLSDILSVVCGKGEQSCKYWKPSKISVRNVDVIRFQSLTMREHCIYTLLLIRRFRPESIVSRLPVDVIKVEEWI